MLDEHQIREVEKYLGKVFDNKTHAENFDKLRYLTHRKTNSVFELPPTSHSVTKGHIPRWWFLYKRCSNLLSGENIDYLKTTDYGWDVVGEELVPNKNLNFLPDKLSLICKCKNEKRDTGCLSRQCICNKILSPCTDYCLCHKCKNVYATRYRVHVLIIVFAINVRMYMQQDTKSMY